MTILHAVARTMLASYFVANGVRTLRHPDERSAEYPVLTEKIMPLMATVLPDSVIKKLPADGPALMRICAMMEIAGGVALGTGIGRRLGATVLAGATLPAVIAALPNNAATQDRPERIAKLTTNIALMGGTLLAAQDTQGKPSLAWQRKIRREAIAEDSAKRKAAAKKDARKIARKAT